MNLDKVFNPKSIAIIGASTNLGTVGNDLVKNLATGNYVGKVFPVNPKATELYGLKCYANIKDIQESVDLAIIVVPAAVVLTVVQEAAEKGVKGLIVISAGFKEVGREDLENALKDVCFKNDIALIGPNCLGVQNLAISMNASFANIMPKFGSVAFLSQSGALCAAVIDYANNLELGFSKFVSMGNKAAIDEVEMLKYLFADPETKIIAMYVEQLRRPKDLIKVMQENLRGKNPKPVIVIKSGRTTAGASASASHTGALAGSDAAYNALFAQSGMIRVERVSELFEFIQVFMNNPPMFNNRVAVVTNAGGPGVLTIDELVEEGMQIAPLSLATNKILQNTLPACANIHNPVDILGDAKEDRYAVALETVAADKDVDGILVILTPQSTTEVQKTAEEIVKVKKRITKPVLAAFMGAESVDKSVHYMRKNGVFTLKYPEQAVRALRALFDFGILIKQPKIKAFKFKNLNKTKVKEILSTVKKQNRSTLSEFESLPIFEAYGIPVPKHFLATTVKEANKLAKEFTGKIVLKIVSEDILHKTDVGGVIVGVKKSEVGLKYTELIARVKKKAPKAKIEGVLLEEMIEEKNSLEMILGVSTDSGLGSMLMVGLGGIYVEVFKDAAFGLPPLNYQDAEKMINKLKTKYILDGVRGKSALDKKGLIDCLGRLAVLIQDFPEIKELDINPVLVLEKRVVAADGRIILN